MSIYKDFYSSFFNQNITIYNDYMFSHMIEPNTGVYGTDIVNEILKYYKPNTDILDIGSHVGLITLGILKHITDPNMIVHCFEADPQTFFLMMKNLYVNHNKRIHLYPCAVTNKNKLCCISQNVYNFGCNFISLDHDEKNYNDHLYDEEGQKNLNHLEHIFIPSISIDSIEYQFKKNISVIKIDVEGSELKVLQGMINIIKKHKPTIIMEISRDFELIKDFIENISYQILYKLNEKTSINIVIAPSL